MIGMIKLTWAIFPSLKSGNGIFLMVVLWVKFLTAHFAFIQNKLVYGKIGSTFIDANNFYKFLTTILLLI